MRTTRTVYRQGIIMKEARGAMPHYQAMVIEANRVGWPQRFRTDLTDHDRSACVQIAPVVPLFWVLRPCGTHLYVVHAGPIDGVGKHVWDVPRMQIDAFGRAACRFYLWDGAALLSLGHETAPSRLREVAVARIVCPSCTHSAAQHGASGCTATEGSDGCGCCNTRETVRFRAALLGAA